MTMQICPSQLLGFKAQALFCLILWFLHTCLHLKEGKREAITPVLPEPEEQAQFCRRKLGRHIFSQLPFPICRSSSAPSLCPQPALDIQSRARHCCHLVHGPDSGINICSPVQFHTSFHAALLHLFRVLSSSGLDLSNAGAQLCTVVFTPWPGTQNCVTMHLSCGHACPFWSQSSSGSQSCWNYYFSKVFARGNLLWKSSLWFWRYFHRVIALGKRCYTCSRLLRSCANSTLSCETNKKRKQKPSPSYCFSPFPSS